jgi:hypothetical protein
MFLMSEVPLYLVGEQGHARGVDAEAPHRLKWLIKSSCKSQFPYKSVNLFFVLVTIKDKLTDLCGN